MTQKDLPENTSKKGDHSSDTASTIHKTPTSKSTTSTQSDDTDPYPAPQQFRGDTNLKPPQNDQHLTPTLSLTSVEGDLEKGPGYNQPPSTMEELSRWTSRNSYRSVRSNLAERDIYGDLPEDMIELERKKSIATVKSQVPSRRYIDDVVANEDLDGNLQDGSAFLDIDPELVTWDSDDDPCNPRNWTSRKKWVMVTIVSLYALISPLSSSIISPAINKIAEDLDITNSVEKSLSVSIFVLAWAICPLFTAPFSEIWGRRIVLNISIVLLVIFNMATALSQTTAQLLVFRFLAGCAGAPPLSISAGTLADMFTDSERNTALAFFSVGPTVGPVLAPIISGFIVQNTSWRWVLWVLTITTGVVAVFGVTCLKETYPPTLLCWKATKLRKETGNPHLHTVFEVTSVSFSTQLMRAVSRPIKLLVLHPIVLGLGLHMAFIYGFMYLLLVTFPTLWTHEYGFRVGIAGLMYAGLGVGFGLGLLVWTPSIQNVYQMLTKRNGGVPKPEFRIPLLVPSSVIMGIGLIWYGWSAQAKMIWVMPCIGTGIYGFGLIAMFQTIQNYLIDMNPVYSASSIAAAAVFRSYFGFGFPLFGAAMYNKLGYGWANTLCGILCFVLGVPFPLFVYFYGERLRKWANKRFS